MFRIALIGYGGIARVHAASIAELEAQGKAKLVAAFDIRSEAFSSKREINISTDDNTNSDSFHAYTDLDEMLANEETDAVDICLPTHLHKSTAIAMLEKGYHVLCEKPMAQSYDDCMEMLDAAKKAGRRLMIGQCLHFFPEYAYLKDIVENKKLGEVKNAFFQRLSSPPLWGWNEWHTNKEFFGSCLHDLHIHDIDMTQYLFGTPDEVFCKTKDGFGKMDGVTSLLMYPKFTSTVIADWSLVNFPFGSEYRVSFEYGTVVDINGDVTVYPNEGEAYKPDIPKINGYTAEISHFVDVAQGARDHGRNHVRGAAETIKIIDLLCRCAEEGGVKKLYN